MIPEVDSIIKGIVDLCSFLDIQAFSTTCKYLSHMCGVDATLKPHKKIKYEITSDNMRKIQFIYKKINRLQIECDFNHLPTSTTSSPKSNLLITKFDKLEHLQYLDLYNCKWISLRDLEIAIKCYLPNLQKLDFCESFAEQQFITGARPSLNVHGSPIVFKEIAKYTECLQKLDNNVRTNGENTSNEYIDPITKINKLIDDLIEDTSELFKTCFIGKYLNLYNIKIPNKFGTLTSNGRFVCGINELIYFIYRNNFNEDLEMLIYNKFISNMYITNTFIELLIRSKLYTCLKLCISNGYTFTPDNLNYVIKYRGDKNFIEYLLEKNIPFYKHSILETLYKAKYSLYWLKLFHKKGGYITFSFIEKVISPGDQETYTWCESVGFDTPLYSDSDLTSNLIDVLVSNPKSPENINISYIYKSLVNAGVNPFHKKIVESIIQTSIVLDSDITWDLINWYITNESKNITIHSNILNVMILDHLESLLDKGCTINVVYCINKTTTQTMQHPEMNFQLNIEFSSKALFTLPLLEWFLNNNNLEYVAKLYNTYNLKLTTIKYLEYGNSPQMCLNSMLTSHSYLNINNLDLWYEFLDNLNISAHCYDILKFLIVKLNHLIDEPLVNKIIDQIQKTKYSDCIHLIVDHLFPKYHEHIMTYCKQKDYDITNAKLIKNYVVK